MRPSNMIALVCGLLWLGGNLTLAFAAMTLFPLAKMSALEIDVMQLGELFGILFYRWTFVGLIFLGVMLIARVVTWTLALKRKQMGVGGWVGVVLFAGLVLSAAAGAHATFAASDAYEAWDRATTEEERRETFTRFQVTHVASTKRNEWMVTILALIVGGLAIGLARRDRNPAE
jgi:hypothetical protein